MEKTIIEGYTVEDLKRLYKSYTLYCTTNMFIRCRKTRDYIPYMTLNPKLDTNFELYKRLLAGNCTAYQYHEVYLDNAMYKNDNEKIMLIENKIGIQSCIDTLFWFAGGIELQKQDYANGCCVRNPEKEYELLHEDDKVYNESGHPTKYEVLEFIWKTLKNCNKDELKKLIKYADKKFERISAGQPMFKWKVIKYDMKGNIIEEYNSRQECMEKNNIKKSIMSQLLSSKKPSYKGYKYKEIKEDNIKK